MADKTVITFNFAQGIDQKTDPKQLPVGKFLELENTVFNKTGLLTKRNGFGSLAKLPDDSFTTATTYLGDFLAVGDSLQLYSDNNNTWIDKGPIKPIHLEVVSGIKGQKSLTTIDSCVASNFLGCIVCIDSTGASYYQIIDSHTGQIVVSLTSLPSTATLPRVFTLGPHFIITFLVTEIGTPTLRYLPISTISPSTPGTIATISAQVSGLDAGYDGCVSNNNLYLAWNGDDMGGAVRLQYLTSTLVLSSTVVIAGHTSDLMSVACDLSGSTPNIWFTFWNTSDNNGYSTAYTQALVQILAPTKVIDNLDLVTLTSEADNQTLHLFYQQENTYSFTPNDRTDYIAKTTCTLAGTVGTPSIVVRGVGLAGKAFYFPNTDTIYMLATFNGTYQPTYFLIDQDGNCVAKLSYSNGAGYAVNQILSSVSVHGNSFYIGYLIKTLLSSVNKSQGAASVSGIYSQIGMNIAKFTAQEEELSCIELGNNLHITGGFLWMYDGAKPVEHSFHLWPEGITVTTATTGGNLKAQLYYYYVTEEWTDAQGQLHRSAPSIPFPITTAGGNFSTNTINIPTLRITYKTDPNPVRIVIYRWSTDNPVPYQITSITSPLLNDPSADSVTYSDTVADSDIIGNVILYTFGGVVENIAAPACTAATIFKSRLILIPAENPNDLWYSKQIVESVPVEFSDLFTLYVAPTVSGQQSTGKNITITTLDDKMVVGKQDALAYIFGNGPDNTGANNDFSDPIAINSAVGNDNQRSIVLIPDGMMFESTGNGIWLLRRDLSCIFIGSDVDDFKSNTVLSALAPPGTNQVRFTLDNGTTLVYDYYYNEWDTFKGVPCVSTDIFSELQTIILSTGEVRRETPGLYKDGSHAVFMRFKTGWINTAGIQGFLRAKYFYILGQYLTPHRLYVEVAYDYNPSPVHADIITPIQDVSVYGGDPYWGSSSPWGGESNVEQWRIFFENQKCQAFQLTVQEISNPDSDHNPGAGLTLSAISVVILPKSSYPRLKTGVRTQIG